jgi:hypothetical protein
MTLVQNAHQIPIVQLIARLQLSLCDGHLENQVGCGGNRCRTVQSP